MEVMYASIEVKYTSSKYHLHGSRMDLVDSVGGPTSGFTLWGRDQVYVEACRRWFWPWESVLMEGRGIIPDKHFCYRQNG